MNGFCVRNHHNSIAIAALILVNDLGGHEGLPPGTVHALPRAFQSERLRLDLARLQVPALARKLVSR